MDPPHLTSRSRYVPLSPPPQFLDPDRYTRQQQQQQQQQQQHHRPPQHFLHPLPPNHQHHYDRDRRLPDDQRVYIQYPKPPDPPAFDRHPPPLSRVPDRVLLPEGHPSARPHRPGRGEPFPRQFLDGRAVDVDRFRVFVERPYPIQSEWKQEPRQGPMPPYRGPPYLPADAGTSIVERKRLRWDHDHDRDLGEEDAGRGSQRRIEFWDDQQLHLHHVHHHHHRNPTFEQAQPAPPFSVAPVSSPVRSRWPDPSFGVASMSSPRDSRFGLLPNKGGRGGGVGGRDSSPVFERRLPPPPLHSTSHSYSDMEVLENNSALDDNDNQENHYVGNRGKRRLSGGYTKDLVRTPTKQKLSVLSRLHSGKSVWERIEERPVFLSSPSPPPHSPPPLPPLPPSFVEEHQLEMDDLDLSYKSNAWVQSSNGKVPTVPETTPKKKVIKKKVAKKRTRVVVPIIAGSNGPTSMDGAPKRPVPTSPDQVLGQVVASPKAILSSGKPVSDVSPRSRPKRVVKTTSLDKSVMRKSAKKIVFSEGSVSHDARGEGKAATLEEEARKYAEALLSEIISTTDNAGSHLLQEGSTAIMTSTEKNAEELVIRVDNSVQAGDVKDIRENECVTTNEKAGPNCAYPIVSEKGVRNDASSHIFIQPTILNMASVQNGAAEGSSKAVPSLEIGIAAAPSKKAPEITEDVANSAHSDAGISMSPIKESPTSRSGFGYETPSRGGVSLKGKREKRKREEEKQKQLAVGTVTEGLEVFGEGKSELGEPWSCSHVNGMPTVLQPEVKDNLDVTPPVGPKDEGDHGASLLFKDVLPESDCMMLKEDSLVVPITDFMDGRMEQLVPPRHSKIDSSPIMSKVQDPLHLINTEQPYVQLSDSNGSSNDHRNYNLDEKPSNKGEPSFTSKKSLASERKGHVKSDESTLLLVPAQPLLLHQPKEQINGNQTVPGDGTIGRKANLSYGVPRVVPNRVISTSSTKETAHSSHNMRNKTWHRNNTPPGPPLLGNLQGPFNSLMHRQSPKKLGRPHSSYIRKGNSLIRKSATEVRPPQQSHGQGVSSRINRQVTKESTCIEMKVSKADHVIGSNAPFERPKTPPLPFDTKIPDCSMDPPRDNPPRDLPHPISEDPSPELDVETQDRQLGNQAVDLLAANADDPSMLICRKSEPSKAKRMVYVKHKSNQLVAAPGPELGDLSSHPTKRAQKSSPFTSSDIYYRRKNNQLVLNFSSSDSQQKQDSVVSVDNSNFDDQRTSVASSLKYSTTSLFKKRADKVLRKTYTHPKFSLVWTSSGEKLHKKGVTSWNCRRVLPDLFPWKRTVYLGNSISNIASISNRCSVTRISRKLQLTRKRDTVYKVSTDGFSLRKAGVLSIGGSSLKWSKSIERHSKRASKEATLAVAEVERKRREKKIGASVGASGKKGNCLPRERVFRVGSARYRMDSSKRTLVRIPDEESSCVTGQQSGNNSLASFVPRRLLIGNDEYVRIGNGNQLVRDPKKLIRILASEKVRWSLHTARLRLARKQQYCQFFTRFGKCNKNGGKCPYIHDPAKVAICTKFLRGLCSNTDCKLTHKVLPERMPDCSYFLQGLCTNVNCPYRHVNVNPNASVCDGFLKGYCADGDECHKKHSYVCPLFEATGKCPQGSKCKLHHPRRSRNKSKKRKQPKDQSYSRGRYFGSSIIEVGEPLIVAKDNLNMDTAGDLFYSDGCFTDYICLDIGSQAHGVETSFPMNSQPAPWDSDLSDMSDDLDVIIKPVRIMNRANLTNCSQSLV